MPLDLTPSGALTAFTRLACERLSSSDLPKIQYVQYVAVTVLRLIMLLLSCGETR